MPKNKKEESSDSDSGPEDVSQSFDMQNNHETYEFY